MTKFSNRTFGVMVVRAMKANYNAGFDGRPRSNGKGEYYATDKVAKWSIRTRLTKDKEDVFAKREEDPETMQPLTLDEKYLKRFGKNSLSSSKKSGGTNAVAKPVVYSNLMKSIDIRAFGIAFASGNNNISILGPWQFGYAIDILKDEDELNDQILSPNRNSNEKSEKAQQNTIGNQVFLDDAVYAHPFSIDTQEDTDLTVEDVEKIKNVMDVAVTDYNSASKKGCYNELNLWVTLKDGSKKNLRSMEYLLKVYKPKNNNGYLNVDFEEVNKYLDSNEIKDDIKSIEIRHGYFTNVINPHPNAIITQF